MAITANLDAQAENLFWLIFLLFVAGLILGARAILRHSGEAPRRATLLAVGVAGLGVAGALVFLANQLLYGLAENGPQYYPFSDYVRYHRFLGGWPAIPAAVIYGLVPAVLAVFGLLARRRPSPVAATLGLAAVLATTLPLMVESAMPRVERGKDAVLHVEEGGYPDDSPDTSQPRVCLEYSVEVSGDEDRLKGPSPTLCLLLRPTREALRLSDTDYDDITVSDIAYDLNRQGVGPYDLPTKVGREGIEIIDAWWDGREPAAGPEVPAQANALTAEDLRAASEQWELGRRGPRDPRDLVGCKLFRADPRPNGLATERRVAVPPKPKVDVVRRSSWIEVSYEFTSLPPGQACLPYAVGGVVSSGGPVETRLVTEAFARVTGATGTLIVPLRLLHGERPERVEVTATAVTGFGSDVVSVPVGAPPD